MVYCQSSIVDVEGNHQYKQNCDYFTLQFILRDVHYFNKEIVSFSELPRLWLLLVSVGSNVIKALYDGKKTRPINLDCMCQFACGILKAMDRINNTKLFRLMIIES